MRDWGCAVSSESLSRFGRASALAAVERMTAQRVEGILAIDPEVDAAAALRAMRATVPLMVLRGGLDAVAAGVQFDSTAGAHNAVRHLLDLGHPTVRHLAGPLRFE